MAAVIDDVVVVSEDAVGEPVVAHELPDVFHHVQLGTFRRQRQQRDVGWRGDLSGEVPSGLIEQQHGVLAWADHGGDLGEVQVHRPAVAEGQDQGRALGLARTDGTEDVGRGVALILRRRWPGAAPRPAAGELVLLAYASLIGEPDFQGIEADCLIRGDTRQRGGEVF